MAEEDLFVDPFDPQDVVRGAANRQVAIDQAQDATARLLRTRQEAYRRIFVPSGDLDVVLSDLGRFCRGDRSAFDADQRIHALLTGRQEVWIRIMDHIKLPLDDLIEKYTGGS